MKERVVAAGRVATGQPPRRPGRGRSSHAIYEGLASASPQPGTVDVLAGGQVLSQLTT